MIAVSAPDAGENLRGRLVATRDARSATQFRE